MLRVLLSQLPSPQTGVPFPDPTPGIPPPPPGGPGVSTVGGPASQGIIEAAKAAGEFTAGNLDRVWQEWVSPSSPLYYGLIRATLPLVIIGFVWWGGHWAQEMIHQRHSTIPLQKVAWPIVVILLLANNGTHLANTTMVGKAITETIANGFLDHTRDGISIRQQIQLRQLEASFQAYLQKQQEACQGEQGEARDKCMETAHDNAVEQAKEATDFHSGLPDNWWDFLHVGMQAKLFIGGVIAGLLWSWSAACHWFFNFLLAIYASTGPLWVSLTLLPMPTKGLYMFISGFFGFSVVIITFNVMVGAAAVSLAQAANGDPLLVPLIMGFLAPAFAVFIGTGSAFGLFVGMTSLASWFIGGGK